MTGLSAPAPFWHKLPTPPPADPTLAPLVFEPDVSLQVRCRDYVINHVFAYLEEEELQEEEDGKSPVAQVRSSVARCLLGGATDHPSWLVSWSVVSRRLSVSDRQSSVLANDCRLSVKGCWSVVSRRLSVSDRQSSVLANDCRLSVKGCWSVVSRRLSVSDRQSSVLANDRRLSVNGHWSVFSCRLSFSNSLSSVFGQGSLVGPVNDCQSSAIVRRFWSTTVGWAVVNGDGQCDYLQFTYQARKLTWVFYTNCRLATN